MPQRRAGVLPLLALTLAELWEARIGNAMSETACRRSADPADQSAGTPIT